MVSIFGRSDGDEERLRSTVRSLGVTSVPGLAAALSWRERKTEKLLAHELARPGTQLVYEPARRLVRWRHPLPPPSAAPERPSRTPAPAPEPARATRAPSSPPPVLRGTALKAVCPSCRVPLLYTGTGKLAVCPECGRLSSERPPTAPSAAPDAAPEPVAPPERPAEGGDRRAQELFAAYVTSRPIPCPRCRTPLKHRGVAEYTCPSCGQSVRFSGAPDAKPVVARAA